MKKVLCDCNFDNYFDPVILSRGKDYYEENRILDIWYQQDLITAYVYGSEIYRVKIRVDDNELNDFSCSCPYSSDGEDMCKHIAAALYYLVDNDIPELEFLNRKQINNMKNEFELSKIYEEMNNELKRISDKRGFVDYYNGRYFVNLISNVSSYIDDFIDNKEYDNAFELIKYSYRFIKDTFMDGSNGEYQDSLYMINESASRLLYVDEYFDIFLQYADEIASGRIFDDFSDAPLHSFILYVHDKDSALRVVKLLDVVDVVGYGIFINQTLDKICLTYDFIDKDDAIKMCYDSIDYYGVKDLLIKYLKNDNKIDEIISILKNDIKNNINRYNAYDVLIDIYDEYGKLDEKRELLPEVIINTNSFRMYKELKEMYSNTKWEFVKKGIISNIKSNDRGILEDIYIEENEADKLIELLRKDPNIYNLAKCQDVLKDKYGRELLDYYKPQIIEQSKRVSDRKWYFELCSFIKKMNEIDNSDDFIFDMLKEMYPNYRNKPAFKEEILNVLGSKNKNRFYKLINKE